MEEACPICNNSCKIREREKDYDFESKVDCPQCGKYSIKNAVRDKLLQNNLHILSWYIRKQQDGKNWVKITDNTLSQITQAFEPTFMEKMDGLLLAYAKDLKNYRDDINTQDKKYIAISCSRNESDYNFCLEALVEKKYLEKKPGSHFVFTPEGLIYCDSLRNKSVSSQGFVAMWFDDSMKEIWEEGIKPAFVNTGFQPLRIDKKEHNEKIDDQIIAEIQRSRFLIADFTGHRGGVYFEAGYALGRGIPVIWTCKKDDLKNLHFDIRQYNTIDWEDAGNLKERLYQRIRATIGERS